jgi:hypothetical protein
VLKIDALLLFISVAFAAMAMFSTSRRVLVCLAGDSVVQ